MGQWIRQTQDSSIYSVSGGAGSDKISFPGSTDSRTIPADQSVRGGFADFGDGLGRTLKTPEEIALNQRDQRLAEDARQAAEEAAAKKKKASDRESRRKKNGADGGGAGAGGGGNAIAPPVAAPAGPNPFGGGGAAGNSGTTSSGGSGNTTDYTGEGRLETLNDRLDSGETVLDGAGRLTELDRRHLVEGLDASEITPELLDFLEPGDELFFWVENGVYYDARLATADDIAAIDATPYNPAADAMTNLPFPEALALARSGYAIRRGIWTGAEDGPALRWVRHVGGGLYTIDATVDETAVHRVIETSDLSSTDYRAWDWTVFAPGCSGAAGAAPTCSCQVGDSQRTFGIEPPRNATVEASENPNAALGISDCRVTSPLCSCQSHPAAKWGTVTLGELSMDYVADETSATGEACLDSLETEWLPQISYEWAPPVPAPPGVWVAQLTRDGETLATESLGEAPALPVGDYYGDGGGPLVIVGTAGSELATADLAGTTQGLRLRLMNLSTGTAITHALSVVMPVSCVGSGSGS